MKINWPGWFAFMASRALGVLFMVKGIRWDSFVIFWVGVFIMVSPVEFLPPPYKDEE